MLPWALLYSTRRSSTVYNKEDPTLKLVSNPWSIFGLGIRILNLHEEISFNGVLQQEEQPRSDMHLLPKTKFPSCTLSKSRQKKPKNNTYINLKSQLKSRKVTNSGKTTLPKTGKANC